MSEFVFNDIYGNELIKERIEMHRQFRYFGEVLKLHNKYYEDNNMHGYIFNPRKTLDRLSPIKPTPVHHDEQKYSFYNVEKINNLTFRVNRKHKKQDRKSLNKVLTNMKQQKDNMETLSHRSRDIIKDVKKLRTVLTGSTDKHKKDNFRESVIGRNNRLSLSSVNREIKNLSITYNAH